MAAKISFSRVDRGSPKPESAMNGLGRGLLRCTCRGTLRTTPCSFERVTRRVSYRLYSVKENPEGSVLASSETKKSSNLPTQYVPKELSSQDVSHLAHECMQHL